MAKSVKLKCGHSKKYWLESTPPGLGYCKKCIEIKYKNAKTCPMCGDKYGFSFGTGDCGCQTDFEVGF